MNHLEGDLYFLITVSETVNDFKYVILNIFLHSIIATAIKFKPTSKMFKDMFYLYFLSLWTSNDHNKYLIDNRIYPSNIICNFCVETRTIFSCTSISPRDDAIENRFHSVDTDQRTTRITRTWIPTSLLVTSTEFDSIVKRLNKSDQSTNQNRVFY